MNFNLIWEKELEGDERATMPEMPETANCNQELKEAMKDSSQEPSGEQLCPAPDVGFLDTRTVREEISALNTKCFVLATAAPDI